METPPTLLQLAPEEGAARVARRWLADAWAAAERLRGPGDGEALHDFRVALRRLRCTLRAWRRELPATPGARRLKHVQRRTGAGRDAEVARTWLEGERSSLAPEATEGARHLAAALEAQHRDAVAHELPPVLEEFDALAPRLDEALGRLRIRVDLDRPRATFGAALARKLRRQARRLEARLMAVADAEQRAAGHAARIAGKRLRYLLEPLGSEADGCRSLCKRLQDALGDWNDAHLQGALIQRILADAPPAARAGLEELGRRSAQRRAALFAVLERDWLGAGRSGLPEAVEDLAAECERSGPPPVEIERKYLLRSLPDVTALRVRGLAVETLEIEQGWLPGRTLRERLRRVRASDGRESFRRTIKIGSGVERVELEEETSREVFETLWPLTEGCRVRKRRHRVQERDWLWEIDEFLDRELALAEVELPAPEIRPALPDWLDAEREVTDEPGFTNLALAR